MRLDVIKLRVFIEGVLIPKISSVSVTSTASPVSSAQVSFPAIPGIFGEDLKRARVHIFWSDNQIRAERNDDEWPMLFEGEIVSDMFRKSPTDRNLGFMCSGFHTYWEQVKLYFYDVSTNFNAQGREDEAIYASRNAVFLGNKARTDGGELIVLDTNKAGANLQSRLLADLTSEESRDLSLPARVRRIFKKSLPANIFFELSDEQLKLTSRFASPRDNQVELLFAQNSLFIEQVRSQVQAKQGETPMLDILMEMLSKFRYGIVCNPQSHMMRVSDIQVQDRIVKAERDAAIERVRNEVRNRFDLELEDFGAGDGLTEKTSDAELQKFAEQYVISVKTDLQVDETALDDAEKDALGRSSDFLTIQRAIVQIDKNRVDKAFAFFKAKRDQLRLINSNFARDSSNISVEKNAGDETVDDLAQFLMLPRMEYAAVPVCNVIFPLDQLSYGMQRNYLDEPTRLATTVPIMINGPNNVFYTPREMAEAVVPPKNVATTTTTSAPSTGNDGNVSLPLRGQNIVKSPFGKVRSFTKKKDGSHKNQPRGGGHGGVDFRARTGTPIYAYTDAKVAYAGWGSSSSPKTAGGPRQPKGLGIFVRIRFTDSSGARVTMEYGHMSDVAVRTGQNVSAGQLIGFAGATGHVEPPGPAGAHLHVQAKRNGELFDPMDLFQPILDNQGTPSEPITSETTEKKIQEEATNPSSQNRFEDYRYLTPEEQVTGIVARFDHNRDHVLSVFAHNQRARGESNDNSDVRTDYLRSIAETNFLDMKFAQRRFSEVPMPFNASVVAGFPGMILDKMRSIIGHFVAVTHTISVSGGSGNASTSVTVEKPRFWNEGDPYHWIGGEGDKFIERDNGLLPDPDVANFPNYYNSAFIPTNSYAGDPKKEVFGGKKFGKRDVDRLYQSLLGVNAVPYAYRQRKSPTTGLRSAFNGVIDEHREKVTREGLIADDNQNITAVQANRESEIKLSPHTILGRYYNLMEQNDELAEEFVREFTRRRGVSEKTLFTTFLGAEKQPFDVYRGPSFRTAKSGQPAYQEVAENLARTLLEVDAFRG